MYPSYKNDYFPIRKNEKKPLPSNDLHIEEIVIDRFQRKKKPSTSISIPIDIPYEYLQDEKEDAEYMELKYDICEQLSLLKNQLKLKKGLQSDSLIMEIDKISSMITQESVEEDEELSTSVLLYKKQNHKNVLKNALHDLQFHISLCNNYIDTTPLLKESLKICAKIYAFYSSTSPIIKTVLSFTC